LRFKKISFYKTEMTEPIENNIETTNLPETKKCLTCEVVKDIDEFYKSKRYPHHSKQHYRSYCKVCQNKERSLLSKKKREQEKANRPPKEPKVKEPKVPKPKEPKPPKPQPPPKPPKEPKEPRIRISRYQKKDLPPKGERLYRFYSLPKELQDQLSYLLSYRGEGKKIFLTKIHKILNNDLLPYKTIHHISTKNYPRWILGKNQKPEGLQALLDTAGIDLR
jgi:hypothetical protein